MATSVRSLEVPGRGLAGDEDGCAPIGFDTDAATNTISVAFVGAIADSTIIMCNGD